MSEEDKEETHLVKMLDMNGNIVTVEQPKSKGVAFSISECKPNSFDDSDFERLKYTIVGEMPN